jgi:hypothetical protein
MQSAVNAWHGGLRASGSVLKPKKCSWCLVAFYWEHGLTIPVPQGDPTIVILHDVMEAIKVGGMIQALNASMDAQVEVLQTKAEKWGEQIQEGWFHGTFPGKHSIQ